MNIVVGLDLGGSTLRAVVMDAADGRVLLETVTGFDAVGPRPIERIAQFARVQVAAFGASWQDVSRVGIGLAGSVGAEGVSMATNIGGLEGIDVERALSSALDCDVIADNDANIAALSEWQALGPRTISDLAVISVGTGVGLGTIVNGRLVRGHRHEAGEVGFLPLSFATAPQTVEDVAGGAALARAFDEAGGESVSGRDVLELAERGNDRAMQLSDRQTRAVAWLATLVHSLLDPQIIVLGGGIGTRTGFAEAVADRAAEMVGDARISIRRSILSQQSVAIGAAHLARLETPTTRSSSSHPLQPETPAQADRK